MNDVVVNLARPTVADLIAALQQLPRQDAHVMIGAHAVGATEIGRVVGWTDDHIAYVDQAAAQTEPPQ